MYGTGAAVPALIAAGVAGDDARIRRAVRWLDSHQNADGGWGEDLRSYVDAEWRGRGHSTASQTAWALLALVAAGEAGSASTRRGVEWLVDTQRPDGTWDEPWFTGTGFPWDFTINYHLYRLVWPVMALGRYVRADGRDAAMTRRPSPRPGPPPRRGPGPQDATSRARGWSAPAPGSSRRRHRSGKHRRQSRRRRRGGRGGRPGRTAWRRATWWWPTVSSTSAATPCRLASIGAPLVAAALRRRGLTVRVGPIVSTPHLVKGPERRASLAATRGARRRHGERRLARACPGTTPVTVIRAISDTTDAICLSPAIIRGGWRALVSLRAATPALRGLGRRGRPAAVLLAGPRSFCAGVERAIQAVERALERFGTPVYVRRQIVHNRHVVSRPGGARAPSSCTSSTRCPTGPQWSSPPTASPRRCAPKRRGEACRSSTPPARWSGRSTTKCTVSRLAATRSCCIGHAGHDETEGTLGEGPGISLVEDAADVAALQVR